jgi:hypothetical protein
MDGGLAPAQTTANINCKLCSHYEYLYTSVRGLWQKTGGSSVLYVLRMCRMFADPTTHGVPTTPNLP